jgi:hypothetical protein
MWVDSVQSANQTKDVNIDKQLLDILQIILGNISLYIDIIIVVNLFYTSFRAQQMLQKLSHHIAACMERAADCRQRAEQIMDPAIKADLLDMETRWADLARNYEFVESLERFVLSARQHRETRTIENDSIAANQNGHGQAP